MVIATNIFLLVGYNTGDAYFIVRQNYACAVLSNTACRTALSTFVTIGQVRNPGRDISNIYQKRNRNKKN